MSWGMKEEPIKQTVTKRMIPRHVHDKPYMASFPDGSEWKDGASA
jgi:hypothetical protein